MIQRFIAMNSEYYTGVFDTEQNVWVVEPEYNWKTAQIMADCLNDDPDLDPDELTKLVEAQR